MRISRRLWLSLALVGAVAWTSALTQNQPASSGLVKIIAGPYLASPSADAMTIMWITDRNATGVVEYGTSPGELMAAFGSQDGLIDGNERIHRVTLTGLSAGTAYRYRVISREILNFGPYQVDFGGTVESGFHEFRTLDQRKQDFSFLVFNDMHDIPATFAELLPAAGDRPYDFVVLNGDILSDFTNESQITLMLSAAASSFASRVPLIWVRGNHETRGALARQFAAYLASPNGRYFYSFDHGPVHFVVLDTGEDKDDGHPEYSGLVDFARYRREEAEWLKAEVQSAAFRDAKYRVVFAHMPFPRAPRSSQLDPPGGMEDSYQNFGAILQNAGIDLMISGHIHAPAIIEPEPGRHNYPIVQGGGPKGERRTLIRVEVNDRGLKAVVLRPDGSALGTARVAAKR